MFKNFHPRIRRQLIHPDKFFNAFIRAERIGYMGHCLFYQEGSFCHLLIRIQQKKCPLLQTIIFRIYATRNVAQNEKSLDFSRLLQAADGN